MLYLTQMEDPAIPSFATSQKLYVLPNETNNSSLINFLKTEVVILENLQIQHKNIWDFTYVFLINKLTADIIYFKSKGIYYRAYKPATEGIGYLFDNKIKPISPSCMWGYKEFFTSTKDCYVCSHRQELCNDLNCTVYLVDLVLTKDQYMNAEYTSIPLNLHLLIDEIIADG